MEDDYRPTARLRFVERPNMDLLTAIAGKSKIRVLQQWWEFVPPSGEPPTVTGGEWRDVSLETP